MVNPVLLGGLLGLAGGGSTSNQNTLTSNSNLTNAFNPSNVISFGGPAFTSPVGNATGIPNNSTAASLTPPSGNTGFSLPSLGALPSVYTGAVAATSGASSLLSNPAIWVIGAGLAYAALKPKKKKA